VNVNGRDKLSYLHREIMDAPPDKEVIFLNHDRLDCRRANLKIVTKKEAAWHHRVRRDSSTGVKGLRYNKSARKWYASITRHGVVHYLGAFDTKEIALDAYREAEERLSEPPLSANPNQPSVAHVDH
jgi:hypothetical protein